VTRGADGDADTQGSSGLNDGRNRTSLMKSTSVSARPELAATLVRLMLSFMT
jgi:hypothetical protein